MIVAMAAGRPGHPDQARRPPAQHAHDRVPAASRSRSQKAQARRSRSTRRSRTGSASTRSSGSSRTSRSQTLHPRKYEEIKAMVAERRADREAHVDEAGASPRRASSTKVGHPGRDLRPREALLLDLRQDGQEGPRVQRDLRPHRDARDRRALGDEGRATATARSASSTRSGSRCPAASRTSSRCRSSTGTARCTRR